MYPNDGFCELDRAECLRLLATAPVGRVVYTRQALPAVVPVNFGLDRDGTVLLHTSAGSELVRAIDGAVVAFEADAVDVAARSGWSVVLTGQATVVTDRADLERAERVAPGSWAPSPDDVLVRIDAELITGRRLLGGRTMYGVSLPGRRPPDTPFPSGAERPREEETGRRQ
ncbi:pyridoxamine 5'-phosphate oxidase family protein [Streptomyces misionensis]